MSVESPAAILFDIAGNPVGVSFDGLIYRLRVESKVKPAFSASRITVSSTETDILLIAANSYRVSVIIYNNSDSPLYIGLGTTPVTATDYTFQISSQSDKEIPNYFVGEIRGVWQVATGQAIITEIT